MRVATLVLGAVALVACGGGGGGGAPSSLPCNLTRVGGYARAGQSSWKLAVSGGRAMIESASPGGSMTSTLDVVDVSTPSSPQLAGSREVPAGDLAIAIGSSKAYVGASSCDPTCAEYLQELDPTTPGLDVLRRTPVQGLRALTLVSDAEAIALSDGLVHVDLAALTLGPAAPSPGQRLAVDGDRAYLAGQDPDHGLQVFDLSRPSEAPALLGEYPNPGGGTPNSIHAYDGVLAICGGNVLPIVDVSDPAHIQPIGVVSVGSGSAESLDHRGKHAFLADGDAGLVVIDISDVRNPRPTQTCSTGGYARQVVVQGDHAYVLSTETGLAIYDISGLD